MAPEMWGNLCPLKGVTDMLSKYCRLNSYRFLHFDFSGICEMKVQRLVKMHKLHVKCNWIVCACQTVSNKCFIYVKHMSKCGWAHFHSLFYWILYTASQQLRSGTTQIKILFLATEILNFVHVTGFFFHLIQTQKSVLFSKSKTKLRNCCTCSLLRCSYILTGSQNQLHSEWSSTKSTKCLSLCSIISHQASWLVYWGCQPPSFFPKCCVPVI